MRKAPLLILVLLALLVTIGVPSAAAASPELSYACALKSNGNARMVSALSQCSKTETAVSVRPGPTYFCSTPDNSVRWAATASGCAKKETLLTVPAPTDTSFCALNSSGKLTRMVGATCPVGSIKVVVTQANHAPTDIYLSPSAVAENQPSASTVGTLSATDADADDSFSYTLVAGIGATDNASFTISGSTLKTTASFDYETQSSYSVRVQTSDGHGGSFDKALVVAVTNVNEAPVVGTVTLSPANVFETSTVTAAPAGFTDPDGDTLSYSYSWQVNGTALSGQTTSTLTGASFNKNDTVSVSVDASDGTASSAAATASTTAQNTPPVAAVDSANSVGAAITISVLGNDSDPDGDPLAVTSVDTTGTQGLVTITNSGADISYDPNGFCGGNDIFTYQAADGSASSAAATVTVTVAACPPPAVALAAGNYHTCALLADGSVKCWGQNYRGQLGNGTRTPSLTPVPVSGITTATAVTAGAFHSCALLADGSIKCWGLNALGQLGDGTGGFDANGNPLFSTTPVTVSGITTATAITAGNYQTCALLVGGGVRCWGMNSSGQLGNGESGYDANYNALTSTTPVTVSGITTATAVTAGENYTCALLADGGIKCWGANYYGQLGDGTTTGRVTPVAVVGIADATAIDGGQYHACALLRDGSLKCWGWNGNGQLGEGTTYGPGSPTPIYVLASGSDQSQNRLGGVTSVTAGDYHTCALLADGSAKCWGANYYYGQLGTGTGINNSTVPLSVIEITGATQVIAGANHNCALLAGGSVKCWGQNYNGELGNGEMTNGTNGTATPYGSSTPVRVIGIP